MPASDWDMHYRSGLPPWETGVPSSELARVVAERDVRPCRVIELGCGSGVNAVWLAKRGFDVTAIDFNGPAIEKAVARADREKVAIRFIQADVLNLPEVGSGFPFFFDRGCYHSVRPAGAAAYVLNLQRVTAPGAVGLILTGNAKEPHAPGQGPPVVSEEELHAELEPAFRIEHLREFRFDGGGPSGQPSPLAWSCWLRKTT